MLNSTERNHGFLANSTSYHVKEMHQVRYFLSACTTLNFTRVAEASGESVPTLSRAIKSLEDELGGQLFRRERHLTHLTDLGRLMQQHFSAMQAAADAARRDAECFAKLDGNVLRLGVFASIGADLLAGHFARTQNHCSGHRAEALEANCEEMDAVLLGNEIDVAITSAPIIDDRLRTEHLYTEAYHAVFFPGHRFSA